MLTNMDKSIYEEHLYQTLQVNDKQFTIAVTFLTGYIGNFIVTITDNNFYFLKSITDKDGFIQITIPPGA